MPWFPSVPSTVAAASRRPRTARDRRQPSVRNGNRLCRTATGSVPERQRVPCPRCRRLLSWARRRTTWSRHARGGWTRRSSRWSRSCCGSPRSSRRDRWCSTTACSRRRRWPCAPARRRSATSSPARARCSFRWCGSADLVGFRTLDAPRLLAVAAGVLVTIAAYSCARRLTTRGNALLAAGLVTTSGSVLWVTGPINADGPALALSVLAVALALRYRGDPRLATAVVVGLAAGGRGVDQGAVGARRAGRRAWWCCCRTAACVARRRCGHHRHRGVRGRGGAVGHRPACGSSRSATTTRPSARRRSRARSARSWTRCGTATCSCWSRSLLAAVDAACSHVGAGPRVAQPVAAPGTRRRRRRPRALGRAGRSRSSCGSPRCGGHTSRTSSRPSRCSPRCGRRRGRCCWSRRGGGAVLGDPEPVDPLARGLHGRDGGARLATAVVPRRTRWSSATIPAWCGGPGKRPPGAFADPSFQRIDDGDITAALARRRGVVHRRVRGGRHVGRSLRAVRRPPASGSPPRATSRSRSGTGITLYARPRLRPVLVT